MHAYDEIGGPLTPQPLSDVEDIGHTCLVPDSTEHYWEATAAWISGGLRAGERVLYFEDGTVERLLTRLADDRVPVDRATAEGQLSVIDGASTRERVSVPLDRFEDATRQLIDETHQQGWPGLRIVGETARLRLAMGLDVLVEYENQLERVLRDEPRARLLCLYDQEHFDVEAIAAMRRVHRTELVTTAVYDDGLLRVTEPEPGVLRFAGELDYSNRSVLGRLLDRSLETMLRVPDRPPDVTVDLSSLRFLDVTSRVELVNVAWNFPTGHDLVLRGAHPHVARQFQRGPELPARLVVLPRWSEHDLGDPA